MQKLLKAKWLIPVIGCLLYLSTTAVLFVSTNEIQPPVVVEEPVKEKAKPVGAPEASWNYENGEVADMVNELHRRKAELDLREASLKKLEATIANQQARLSEATNWVEEIRMDIDKFFSTVTQEEDQNFQRIIGFYKKMDPQNAAKMLFELDDERIAKIFKYLSDSEVTGIIQVWINEGDKLPRVNRVLEFYNQVVADSPVPPAG